MSGRRHEEDFGCLISEIFDGRENRLRFHDHSLAAAEGCVIRDVMFIRGPVPQVMNLKVDNPIFPSTPHDALTERRAADFRKQRENVDLHSEENVERPVANVQ